MPKAERLARTLEHWSIALRPEQLGVLEGLRAAVAVWVMVAASEALGQPILAWAAFAAFWTCLADPGGPMPVRVRALGLFSALGTVLAGTVSFGASLGAAVGAALLFSAILVCGLVRLHRWATNQVSVLASVVAVVAIDYPRDASAALQLSGVFLLGSLSAIVLCTTWRIHPYRPARQALRGVFRSLSELAFDLGRAADASGPRSQHRALIRDSLERARSLLDNTVAARNDVTARSGLVVALDAADRFFAGLIALEHWPDRRPELLGLAAEVFDEMGRQVMRQTPDWSRLRPCLDRLKDEAGESDRLPGRVTALWRAALADLLAAAPGAAGAATRRAARQGRTDDRAVASALRHALRVAVTVSVVNEVTTLLGLPFGYWATMAVVVVMQPEAAATLPRMLERIVGSILGGLAAALVATLLPSPLWLSLVVFPVAAATIALRGVNYALFVSFTSALFVLVAAIIQPGHGGAIGEARALNNVLGSIFAMLGTALLWPDPLAGSFRRLMERACEANLAYCEEVMRRSAEGPSIDNARRAAGVASTAAEVALHRLILMGRRRRLGVEEASALLADLRRLAGVTTVQWLTGDIASPTSIADQAARCRQLAEDWSSRFQTGAS